MSSRTASCRRLLLAAFAACLTALGAGAALASDIGISPTAVHLEKAADRSTLSVVNNGTETVVMQAEVVEWRRNASPTDDDVVTNDVIVNPAVFTLAAGQTQVVRVGMRKPASPAQESTYRVVLREVPTPPQPGEVRQSGQVRVLMQLRVPVYVAPLNVVKEARWVATRDADGSIVASLQNQGNVHVRVGRLRLRPSDDPAGAAASDQPVAETVFPGEVRKFKVAAGKSKAGDKLTLDVSTDQGPYEVPVVLAGRN